MWHFLEYLLFISNKKTPISRFQLSHHIMTSWFVYVKDRIDKFKETSTKFAPSETTLTEMIWFSDIMCVHMYLIIFRAFGNYSTSLREFILFLERFSVNLRCFVPAKRHQSEASLRFVAWDSDSLRFTFISGGRSTRSKYKNVYYLSQW